MASRANTSLPWRCFHREFEEESRAWRSPVGEAGGGHGEESRTPAWAVRVVVAGVRPLLNARRHGVLLHAANMRGRVKGMRGLNCLNVLLKRLSVEKGNVKLLALRQLPLMHNYLVADNGCPAN